MPLIVASVDSFFIFFLATSFVTSTIAFVFTLSFCKSLCLGSSLTPGSAGSLPNGSLIPLNVPPATAPRTADSITLSQSSLSKYCEFPATKFSALILIASWAPSVKASAPEPLAMPVNTDLVIPGRVPDLFNILAANADFSNGVIFLRTAEGNTESKAAAAAPNKTAVPVASSPVSS